MIISCGSVVLCSGVDRKALHYYGALEAPGLDFPGGKRQVQEVAYVRSATADVFDRGNAIQDVAFAVRRVHRSLAAAQHFRATHRALVEGTQGTWLFQPEVTGLGITETLKMVNGLLREVTVSAAEARGLATLTKYVIAGPPLTTVRPPPN